MEWVQIYDPLNVPWLSTLVAALPIVVLLVTLAALEWKPYWSAAAGLAVALVVAVGIYGMPAASALATALYGAAYGFLPIGWIVLNAAFLYNLTVRTGQFEVLRAAVAHLSDDPRVQVLLIAFSFGAFLEGAAGFGAPVAITAALLIGLGFTPLHAAGLSLIANTAPVAFGAIGTPILTLAAVTELPAQTLSAMAGRQLPFMSLLIPAWLVATMSGWAGLRAVWPAVLVSGASFAIVQFAWSNYVGPELVDIVGGLVSLGALTLFCRVWRASDRPAADRAAFAAPPITAMPGGGSGARHGGSAAATPPAPAAAAVATASGSRLTAMMPWIFLSVFVLLWGLPAVKARLNGGSSAEAKAMLAPAFEVPALHGRVYREFPVEPDRADPSRLADPAYKAERAEAARFTFNWLSATGTAILITALVTAVFLRVRPGEVARTAGSTLLQMRPSLYTISLMLALGFVTRYSGTDATLGLAFTKTGAIYPFFAALLGWLGVALTGSDTSSNVLFGSLQKVTAEQLNLSPILICTANSTGGVMGKMIDAQSIVVATAATRQIGQEGRILRFVFWHSVALAVLMGLIVMSQAYWLTWMIPAH
jgi:lactate permease